MQVVEIGAEPLHHLVFENEHVRIFNVEVPAQQSTLVHRHGRNGSVVIVGPAEVEDEKVGEAPKRTTYAGAETHAIAAGMTHKVKNVGRTVFRNVVIEFK